MSVWYLDTSAALKLLLEEPESDALARRIDQDQPDLVACWLLETELRRVAHREQLLTQQAVTTFLEGVAMYEVPGSLFREAGLMAGPHLRSRDALHLAAAIRIGVDAILTYDERLRAGAQALGVTVLAPR